MKDSTLVQEALAEIRRAGCEGEIYIEQSRSTKVSVSGGKVECLEVREDRGAGVRLFDQGRAGFSFTAELAAPGIASAIERARSIATVVASDPANRLPADPGQPFPDMRLFDPRLAEVPVRRKIEMALGAEEAARAAEQRVSGVRESSYQDVSGSYHLANTAGMESSFCLSRAHVSVELKATEGDESQTGWHAGWKLGAEGLDPASVGREAARKAAAKLGARPAETGRMTVLLSPEVTASLFGELAALFSADAVLKGRSLLAGKAGDRIASSNVTLIDDGRHPEGYASAPVDGEGVASRETVLIDRGVLRGFLQSAYTAARMGTSLTGNALRGDYCSRPHISRTNLYLRPTGVSAEQLLRGVSAGVCVTEVMGLHTINPVTGDFSLGASGLRIESGRLTVPVDRMAIAGNILELLGSVEAVADDLEFLVIGPGATVLLRNLAVSGQ